MFTKHAIELSSLRNIVKTKIAPKFIRYGKNNKTIQALGENHDMYHMPRAIGAITRDTQDALFNKGISDYLKVNPHTDQIRIDATKANYEQTLKHLGLHKDVPNPHIQWGSTGRKLLRKNYLPEKPKGKIENTAFNDIVAHHENNELTAGKHLTKAITKDGKTTMFASHFHPDVVLKEHNVLSSLSGADDKTLQNIKNTFRAMRSQTGETQFLDNAIPGGFASGPRINRRHRKFLSDKFIASMNS